MFLQVETRKPTVLSVNLHSKELSQSAAGRQLSRDVAAVNQRWDRVCAKAGVWQKELQVCCISAASNTFERLTLIYLEVELPGFNMHVLHTSKGFCKVLLKE